MLRRCKSEPMNNTHTIAQLFDLSECAAVVTGGAMGIGQAIAWRLTEAGAAVMIADIDQNAANKTADGIRARGGRAQAVYADARSATDAEKVMRATKDAFGRVSLLVNNAGIYPLMPFVDVTDEMLDRTIDVNLKGTFKYSREAARMMIDAGQGGRIVNVASVNGLHPDLARSHYSASKGGVVMLTKAMALELAPLGILVNAVAPGSIMTTPGQKGSTTEYRAAGHHTRDLVVPKTRYPVGRTGVEDDVAKVVLFLASRAADYVCGCVIPVDGGVLLS